MKENYNIQTIINCRGGSDLDLLILRSAGVIGFSSLKNVGYMVFLLLTLGLLLIDFIFLLETPESRLLEFLNFCI
jgi:hypothetical protein